VHGDELYTGRKLAPAVAQYRDSWLPLIHENAQSINGPHSPTGCSMDLALPSLAPQKYHTYCINRFGCVCSPRRAFLFSEDKAPPSSNVDFSVGDYDLQAASHRQRTFLWHVSQCDAKFHSTEAIGRYTKFLHLMKIHGYRSNFFVPAYDIDFVWHTHMLLNTLVYMHETSVLANTDTAGVNHDDSVERGDGSKLNRGWEKTKELWAASFPDTIIISTPTTEYREPPSWFFEKAENCFRVTDGFLSQDELSLCLNEVVMCPTVVKYVTLW